MQVLAIFVLLAVSSCGFAIAYMTSQTDSDEAVVVTNANKVVSDLLDSVFTVVDTLRTFVQSTVLFVVGNIWTLALLSMFMGVALSVHYESQLILSTLDRFIRRILYPATKLGILQTLHLMKFVYATFVPVYNFAVVVQTQFTSGVSTIIAKCSARTFISAIHLLAGSVVSFFEGLALFFKGEGVFENDLNITKAVWGVQLAVQEQEKTVSCVCRQLSPFAQVALSAAKPYALAQCVNAWVNIGVSAVQEPVRIFTNSSFPDFQRSYAHVRDFFYYGGKYLDEVALNAVEKFISALQVRLELQMPEIFLAGIASHYLIAFSRMVQWMQTILTNMVIPRPSKFTNTTFMVELLSVTPIFVELDRTVEGTGDLIEWTLNTIVRGVKDVYDPLQSSVAQTSTPLPPLLTDEDTRQASNLFKHGAKAILAVPHVLMDGFTTILWKAVISRNQTLSEAFKDYDGGWYDDSSCTARVSRGENCTCEYTARDYNPFCANPTLQADLFYNLEKMFDAVGHFGFQFLRPVASGLKLLMQTVRVVLRGLFYMDDIVAKDFFHNHINHKDNPYNGEERCTDMNRPGCEFNPTLPARDAICMYSFPDDLVTENPDVVSMFYANADQWCNSLLIEFVLRELSALTGVLSDALMAFDPRCDAYTVNELQSDHNLLCAAALAVDNILQIPMNLFRQLNSELVGVLDAPEGVILHTHFDTLNRFTDVERALFASVGTLGSPFPSPFDKTVTKIGYSLVSFPVVALRAAYYATVYARQLILSDNVDWDKYVPTCEECLRPLRTVPSGALGFVYVEVRLFYVWLIELLTAFKSISDFFQGFIDITNILMSSLSQPLLDVLQLILKVGADVLEFFSSGNINAGGFLSDLVSLVTKGLRLLARVSTRILGSLLDALGPLGSFLRTFASGICKTIYAVLCSISAIIGTDSFCDDSDCLSGGLRAKDHPFNRVPKDIAALGWHDDSRCDRLVIAYQDYLWGDLRPLEQIELQECVEQRYIAMSLADALGVALPVDMLYNWKRKFEMAYHGGLGALLYVRHLLGESSVHFKHQWDFWEVPDYWLHIFRMTHSKVQQFEFPMDAVVEALRGEPGSASDVLVNVLHAANHSVRSAHDIWVSQPSFEWNITFPEYTLGSAPQRTIDTMDYAWDIQTDIDFVGYTQCALLDNTIEMFEQQADFIVTYYQDVYMNVTVPHFLAWLEYDDPWVADFERVMRETTVSIPDFYDLPPPDTLNANAGGCALPSEDDTLAFVAELFRCFVTGTGDAPLPYVQHNLEYMLKYQFRTCKQEQISWHPSEMSDRVDRMMESLLACLYVTVGAIALQRLTLFPIGVFAPVLGVGYLMIFATHVWNYTLFCAPNAPVSLLDDLFAFFERYMIPKCMCEYFPTLTNGCVTPDCHFISQTQLWDVCETKLNVLYGAGEGDNYFNIFWSPFMLAREYVPQALEALHYFPPLYQWDAFSVWMERERLPISALERDCVQFHFMNNAVVLIAGLACLFFASSVVATLVKLVLIPIKVIPSVCSLAYSMLVSLDAQTMLPVKTPPPQPQAPPPSQVPQVPLVPQARKKKIENLIIRI